MWPFFFIKPLNPAAILLRLRCGVISWFDFVPQYAYYGCGFVYSSKLFLKYIASPISVPYRKQKIATTTDGMRRIRRTRGITTAAMLTPLSVGADGGLVPPLPKTHTFSTQLRFYARRLANPRRLMIAISKKSE